MSDYSKGFGGKYGVQTERMDKVRYVVVLEMTSGDDEQFQPVTLTNYAEWMTD